MLRPGSRFMASGLKPRAPSELVLTMSHWLEEKMIRTFMMWLILGGGIGSAIASEEMKRCGQGDPHSRVVGCTAVIRDRNSSVRELVAAFDGRCWALNDLKKFREALEDCNAAIKMNPQYAFAHNNRGVALEQLGYLEEAQNSYAAAAQLNPSRTMFRENQKRISDMVLRQPNIPTEFMPGLQSGLPPLNVTSSPTLSNGSLSPHKQPTAAQSPMIPLARQGRRVALVIGNADYSHATLLPNAVNDATAISESLRNLQFEVMAVHNQSAIGFRRALRDFSDAAKGAEVALFFFAGHGLQMGQRDRVENYLVPVDARLADARDMDDEAIALSRILQLMEGAQARLVILDACRDNPLLTRMPQTGGTRSVSRGLAPIDAAGAHGTLVAFSTAPGAVAADGTGRNSPFTAALVNHLRTPGLELRGVLTRVRAEVAQATGNVQVPWSNDGLLSELFLAGPSGSTVTPPLAQPSVVLEAATIAGGDLAFWQSAERGGTRADYEAYLRTYPTGRYVDLARNRLAVLMVPDQQPKSESGADSSVMMASFRSAGFFRFNIPSQLHVTENRSSSISMASSDRLAKADVVTKTGLPGRIVIADQHAKEGNSTAGYSPCASLPPSYRLQRADIEAFSCIGKNGKIVYEYSKFQSGRQISFHIEYPITQRKYWDEAVKQMVQSLSFD